MSLDIAKTHYTALRKYLASHLIKEKLGISAQRQSARDKLVRLTQQQFQELSTDVYDELCRRLMNSPTVPFLPLKTEYHPKRNQARQKLATLPKSRFKDLASDVFAELSRRYPQFGKDWEAIHGDGEAVDDDNIMSPGGASNASSNNIMAVATTPLAPRKAPPIPRPPPDSQSSITNGTHALHDSPPKFPKKEDAPIPQPSPHPHETMIIPNQAHAVLLTPSIDDGFKYTVHDGHDNETEYGKSLDRGESTNTFEHNHVEQELQSRIRELELALEKVLALI